MRIVTKNELLSLPPYTIFRAWEHDVWDSPDWEIKTGKEFEAIELSPEVCGDDSEDLENITDWDGQLDLDNDPELTPRNIGG